MLNWKATWLAIVTFFTKAEQPYALATARILFGGVCLLNALLYIPDVHVWFSDQGAVPSHIIKQIYGTGYFSLFEWFGSSTSVATGILVAYAAASCLLLVGCYSRTSAFIVYLCYTSFCHRNIYVTSSADTLLRLFPLFFAFSSCGRVLSVDSWRAYALHGRTLKGVSGVGLRLMQVQLCLLYLVAGIFKSAGAAWRDGTAIFIVQQITEFQRFPLPDFMQTALASRFLAWGTLAIELLFPLLIWFRETRLAILIAAFGLHLGLEYAMNIQMFQLVMLSMLVTFVKDHEVLVLAASCRKPLARCFPASISVYYDDGCGRCRMLHRALKSLDVLGRTTWFSFRQASLKQDPTFDLTRARREILVQHHAGQWVGGVQAVQAILLRLPLIWPLGAFIALPGIRRVARHIARAMAPCRHHIPQAMLGQANGDVVRENKGVGEKAG